MRTHRSRIRPALKATAVASALACCLTTAHAQDSGKSSEQLETVIVTGLRKSQERDIDLKRNAATIVDSITAQDIGKLPDATITDSLQRISGVQIRREAGEGTAVNIRGLPQVGTLLNGEEFITAGSITSVRPNYSDIPSQLFAGADVYKSSTGKLLGAGISGTVNLRTIRPLDLRKGWLTSVAAEYGNGNKVDAASPSVNGLVAYTGNGLGFLLGAAVSDSNGYTAREGKYGGAFSVRNEGLSGETFRADGVPRGTPVTNAGGTVIGYDVNGNGTATDAYFNDDAHRSFKRNIQRKRAGVNAAFQADVTDDLRLTAEAFFTKQDQYDRGAGLEMSNTSWSGAQFTPGKSTPKVQLPAGYGGGNGGYTLNTVQKYDVLIANLDSLSETAVTKAKSTNANLELDWDNGGALKLKARALYGKANRDLDNSYAQFSLTDGNQWSKGIGYYPQGTLAFNAGGIRSLTVPASVDYTGEHPQWTLPASVTSRFSDPANYALKTISSENNNHANVKSSALRLDGSYAFSTNTSVDFGVRHGSREVDNFAFDRLAPVYKGQGASDPNGCLVKWKAFDVRLDNSACTAGNAAGAFTAGLTRKMNDPTLLGQYGLLQNMPGNTPAVYGLSAKAMDNPAAFHERLYPGEVEAINPGQSYHIEFKQDSFYMQGNTKGYLGDMPWSANLGVKHIKTKFDVQQHDVGASRPYGAPAADLGVTVKSRSFSDTLPAFNFVIDPVQDVKVRLAYAKNMSLLDLQNWGGGLRLNYGIDTSVTPNIFRVLSGNQDGNPDLDPWRSKNLDLSFEWYNRPGGLVSLAFYKIDIATSIGSGSINRPDLPDLDGVVRRGATVQSVIQQKGSKLKGMEIGTKQRLDFLPGFLSGLGVEATATLSLADTQGNDLAGNKVLFGDNSRLQTNLVLWYERNGLQVRLAHNHRSKRADQNNYQGWTGLTLYQAATNYVDASVSYDVNSKFSVYGQVSNLTNEYDRYYVTWADQKAWNNVYERKYLIGVRAKF